MYTVTLNEDDPQGACYIEGFVHEFKTAQEAVNFAKKLLKSVRASPLPGHEVESLSVKITDEDGEIALHPQTGHVLFDEYVV